MPATRRKPRVGLALGSGGARGWSHIGVIRALKANGVEPAIVCGTSIGALVGAAFASGELDRLERWVRALSWTDVLKLVDVSWRGGLIKGQKLFDFFRSHYEDRELKALAVSYGAVATDLGSGREVWLREGKVLEAVRASIAMPGVFAPVRRDGLLLVDGGLVNPVPVSMCRALGAEVVVAVDLGWAKLGRQRARTPGKRANSASARLPPWLERFEWVSHLADEFSAEQERESAPSILEVFMTSIDIMQVRAARSRLAGDPADVLLTPRLPNFVTMDFHRAAEAIDEGRKSVERMLPALQQAMEG
jgi:NTE family protein